MAHCNGFAGDEMERPFFEFDAGDMEYFDPEDGEFDYFLKGIFKKKDGTKRNFNIFKKKEGGTKVGNFFRKLTKGKDLKDTALGKVGQQVLDEKQKEREFQRQLELEKAKAGGGVQIGGTTLSPLAIGGIVGGVLLLGVGTYFILKK